MKNIFVLCLALAMSLQVLAQQRRVSGTVIDARDNSAMIGANIVEKGTSNGTVTDVDGKFSLLVASPQSVLVVSSIGYQTIEVMVGDRSTLHLELDEDSELLDEVVVVGYGTMRKSDLSGASVTVTEDKLRGTIATNLDQALQGRAAGVTSVMTSGAPGANGVVLITTKRGSEGKARFTYESIFGIQNQVKRLDMMNLREYATYSNALMATTAGGFEQPEYSDPS